MHLLVKQLFKVIIIFRNGEKVMSSEYGGCGIVITFALIKNSQTSDEPSANALLSWSKNYELYFQTHLDEGAWTDQPKSAILTVPLELRMRFSGLISL